MYNMSHPIVTQTDNCWPKERVTPFVPRRIPIRYSKSLRIVYQNL